MRERRETPRFAIDWAVDYKIITTNLREDKVYESSTINISGKGLAFVVEEPLPDERIVALTLHTPVFAQPSLSIGRVRWQRRIGKLSIAGVQWIEWEDDTQLDEILEYASKNAHL